MEQKHKTGLKWAGIITGIGSVVGAVTPLVIELKSDEKELHKDESIIDNLNGRLFDLTNRIHDKTDELKDDVNKLTKNVTDLESAVNLLMREITPSHSRLEYKDQWRVD